MNGGWGWGGLLGHLLGDGALLIPDTDSVLYGQRDYKLDFWGEAEIARNQAIGHAVSSKPDGYMDARETNPLQGRRPCNTR